MQSRIALYQVVQGCSGQERWDVPSPIKFNFKWLPKLAVTHTIQYVFGIQQSTQHKGTMLYEHLHASLTTDSYCSYIHTDNVHKANTI